MCTLLNEIFEIEIEFSKYIYIHRQQINMSPSVLLNRLNVKLSEFSTVLWCLMPLSTLFQLYRGRGIF